MEEATVKHKGLEITVTDKHSTGFSVYFRNQPGNFEPLGNIKSLRGYDSLEAGIAAGKQFVDEHQWEHIADLGMFSVYVRLWWRGRWGYSVRSNGSTANLGNFGSREEAEEAGKKCAEEKIAELDAEVQRLSKP